MISEERLKTLIEQEKIVYDPDTMWGEVGELKLNKTMKVIDGKVCGDIKEDLPNSCSISCNVPLEDLFETEEEAEEYLKYGNVTRTEKFPYVSWEEIDKDFQNLANGTYTIAEDKYIFSLNIKVNKPFVGQILLVTEETNFYWNYSRENYHKALDLAIRLWKGEE